MSEYRRTHLLAKGIVCVTIMLLLTMNIWYTSHIIMIAIVPVWFFGVNITGFLLEAVLHKEHEHDKV